jgi:hypothetical protein
MGNPAMTGMTVGTVIMPGAGTVIGAAAGGLVGLFSGPDAQQQSANVGGRTIDARQIWEQIHTGNSDSLHQGATAAGTLHSVHDDRANQIDEINKAMDAAWQGDASLQVQAGAHPLGIWLRDSASNLQKSSTYLTSQGEAFDTAHSKVQEIAATPPHAGFMDHMNPFSDKDDEINKYNEQGQANVQAFQAYYNASASNAAGMPQYSAWQGNTFSEGDGKHKPGENQGTNPPGTGTFPPGTGSYPPGSVGNVPGGSTDGLSRVDPKVPSTGSLGHTGVGDPDRYQPSPPGIGADIGYQPPTWNDGTTAAGFTPSTSGTDFGGGDFGGGFGPTGSGYGGAGSGSGSGGFGGGAGGIGGFGPGGTGALGAGASTGAGAGSGAGGAAGAGRGGAGAGAAGAGGRAGNSGMAGMGHGGRGKGSDDEEHQTKYLVSEDPNELFGTDELTAPPVIGE